MPGGILLTIIRTIILLGLVAAFALSLGVSLVSDPRMPPSLGSGPDRGIRVLLTSRRTFPDRTEVESRHERLLIDVLRPSWLVAPDAPDDPQYTLKIQPGEQILIKPDVDGLVFSSQTWGKEERWPVTRLRLLPRDTTLSGSATDASPGRWPAGLFEDSARQAVFAMGGRRYRGSLDISSDGVKHLRAVNLLPIEAYVEGVIAVEMKASYPLDALKAQAVASRGYAYANAWTSTQARKAWDLTDSLDDQEYRGTGFGNDFTGQAVRETAGLILVTPRLRRPFVPYFCASNGGWAENVQTFRPNAKDVTGSEPVTSLMMSTLPDHFCQRAAAALGYLESHWEQQVVLQPDVVKARLQEWLKTRGDQRQVGYITDIKIAEQDPKSLRVHQVAIEYTPLQTITMSGHEFRMMMGPQNVRSTLWLSLTSKMRTGERRVKDWVVVLRGYGHGVGLCQISAWAMAKEGFSFRQILQTYYPGAELQPW